MVWSGGVVESDYSVSFLSEKEREKKKKLDNIWFRIRNFNLRNVSLTSSFIAIGLLKGGFPEIPGVPKTLMRRVPSH